MTARHWPGGPLWQPVSRSGIADDEDRAGVYPGPDMPAWSVVYEPSPREEHSEQQPGLWDRPAGAAP